LSVLFLKLIWLANIRKVSIDHIESLLFFGLLLLLGGGGVGFDNMVLAGAALLLDLRGEPQCISIAAGIEALVEAELEARIHWVERAVVQFRTHELPIAIRTVELLQPRKHLQKDILPVDLLLLAQEHDELVHVPRPIGDMLRNDCPMKVYEDLGLVADHPLSLGGCEEHVTVRALVQHV